jgi:hypothetical protein
MTRPGGAGRKAFDDARLDPDLALALVGDLGVGDGAERQRVGDGLEGGFGDGNADHRGSLTGIGANWQIFC